MIETVPDILARIVATKREEVSRANVSVPAWERAAEDRLADRRDFRAALGAKSPAIIAEVKKASPSRGVLTGDFDPARTARSYESGGAAAISVLTDERYFQGGLAELRIGSPGGWRDGGYCPIADPNTRRHEAVKPGNLARRSLEDPTKGIIGRPCGIVSPAVLAKPPKVL